MDVISNADSNNLAINRNRKLLGNIDSLQGDELLKCSMVPYELYLWLFNESTFF